MLSKLGRYCYYKFKEKYLIFSLILLWSVTIILSGCGEAPRDFEVTNIKLDKLNVKATTLKIGCSCFNPNNFNIKINDMKIRLLVEGIEIGTVDEVDKIKLKRKQLSNFEAYVKLNHLNIAKLIPLAVLKSNLETKAEGDYKVKLLLVSKTFHNTQFITVNIKAELYKLLINTLKDQVIKP